MTRPLSTTPATESALPLPTSPLSTPQEQGPPGHRVGPMHEAEDTGWQKGSKVRAPPGSRRAPLPDHTELEESCSGCHAKAVLGLSAVTMDME